MSAPASALQDTGESIAPYVLVAVLAHAGMLCCLVLVEALYALFAPEFKPIDPDTFIEITAVSMPAQRLAPTIENATRAAPPPSAAEPAPTAPAFEPPPPTVQSDLAFQQPKPVVTPVPTLEKPAAAAVDHSAQRDAAMRDVKMSSLLDELAEDGPSNRTSGGPNVDPRVSSRTPFGSGAYDPALSPYVEQVRRILKDRFNPLPVFQGKGYKVKLKVLIDDSGRVLDAQVKSSSGNASYDAAAKAAATSSGSLPRPPETLQDGQPQWFDADFSD
jgi:TonB family protein